MRHLKNKLKIKGDGERKIHSLNRVYCVFCERDERERERSKCVCVLGGVV